MSGKYKAKGGKGLPGELEMARKISLVGRKKHAEEQYKKNVNQRGGTM